MFKIFSQKKINFVQDAVQKVFLIKKNKKESKIYKIIKYLCLAILAIFVFFIIFLAANFFAVKQIYQETILGKNNLEQAVAFTQMQNFSQAKIFAKSSSINFLTAITGAEQLKDSWLIKRLPYFKNQINNAEYLLTSVEFLSQATSQSAGFGQELESGLGGKKLTFSKFSREEKQNILQQFYQATPELNGLKANIALALINLEQVDLTGWLFFLKNRINELKEQLFQAKLFLEKATPFSEILPAIAGYPEKAKFLIILQNNDELRPTGGFIGTYGIMEIDSGDITELVTHDIYHLDMPVKDKINIEPPLPIKKYLTDKWYMRDANWSPDWPSSAKKIEWFYQIENKFNNQRIEQEKFSGVIAITPKIIIDLLTITGPVEIDNTIYDKNNFQELLQYKVEKDYINLGIPSWQRKEVIGEIVKELKIKLFDLPVKQWPEILTILNNNLGAKNILIYLSDPVMQDLVKQQEWAGEIKNTKHDYLMVVDANMAALKTDAVINRGIKYEVDQNMSGLFAKLKINYAHQGNFDWKTTRYRTWTRVYVPLGSKLIKTSGFVDNEAVVADELGKTFFGGFISIEHGNIGNVYLEYKLPDVLNKLASNYYNLYIQKQPGSDVNQVAVDANFLNDIKSYSPAVLHAEKVNSSRIKWETDLNMDKSFNVSF